MKYTVCTEAERSARPVLLFEGVAVEEVAADPAVHAFFPHGYFVKAFLHKPSEYRRWNPPVPKGEPTHTMVSTVMSTLLPDEATIDTPPLLFFLNGVRHEVNLRKRYNQCLSLFKAVGCQHCPDRGKVCFSEAAGVDIPQSVGAELDADDLCERLEENKTVIAGREFISPTKTKTDPFQKKLRPVQKHDFEEIEANAKKRSKASSDAAETKKFKKTECIKCPIKDSCDRSAWCKGAYPPVEEIIEVSEKKLTETLAKSPWPEWQLWEVAHHMGETAKVSRWNVTLTGLKLQGTDGIVPTVHRAKGSIDPFGKLPTYEDMAKAFGMALSEADVPAKRGPVTDKKLRALLWLTLKTGRGSRSRGWGNSLSIVAVGCNHKYVSVLWTSGSYLTSHAMDIHEVRQIASHLSDGQLGDIDHVAVR